MTASARCLSNNSAAGAYSPDYPAVMRNCIGSPSSPANRWILVLRPPRERTSLVFAPFLRPVVTSLCAYNHRVDHQILVLLVRNKIVEDTLPHLAAHPARELSMHGLVLAVTLRKITPPCSQTQHTQHAVDKLTVFYCRPPYMLHAVRKKVLIRDHCDSFNSSRL